MHDAVFSLPVETLELWGDPDSLSTSPFIACVPACNEAGWIARCLRALNAELRPDDGVLLLANGCTDATIRIAREEMTGWKRPGLLVTCRWQAGQGNAPLARRLALDMAHALAPDAALFSVDGDTVVLPGLRDAYARRFVEGFDLVCGRIGFIPEEAAELSGADPDSEAVIRAYREMSRQIAALIRPDPDNPWPHHGNIGGANFAMCGSAYATAGPLPTPMSGEDRALRRRFEAHGLRIRYCDDARVATSCRLEGRAAGGLSEELKRNRTQADPLVDELLEPPETLVLRCRSQVRFLAAATVADRLACLSALDIPPAEARPWAEAGGGLSWHGAEDASPVLRRTRLRLSDLRRHLPALRHALETIPEARSGSASRTAP